MSAHDDMAAVFAPVERAGRTQALTEALVAASARVTGHDEPDCPDTCTPPCTDPLCPCGPKPFNGNPLRGVA